MHTYTLRARVHGPLFSHLTSEFNYFNWSGLCLSMLSQTGLNQLKRNVYLCICVIVFLYLRFDTWEHNFWYPWTILFSKIYHMLGFSGTSSYAVFVYLCICIFVFALLTHGNIIFDILELSSFQKYTTWWVFLALCHMLYLCICVFVYLCLCIWVGKVSTRPIWP